MHRLLIGELIRAAAERAPHRTAVIHGGTRLSFAEVAESAEHLARVIAARGVGRGDRVVWWGRSDAQVVPLFFALAHLGAVFAPLNPRLTVEEARPMQALVDPALVIADDDHPGDVTLQALLAQPRIADATLPQVEETDPHAIFFTSGTTGQPKGVVLSHRVDYLRAAMDAAPLPHGPTVCTLAQFHKGGWGNALEAWIAGDAVIYADTGDPDLILDAIDRHRATRIYAIPAVWRRILDARREGLALGSLRHADTGTSPTSPELLREIAAAFPAARITIVYGSTESGPSCRLWPEDVRRKPHSVGPPCPGVRLRIEDGQLLIRSPHLASGYFRNADATAEAFSGGWYRTGELAERDDEGFYRIVGRVKDIIRTGGETVSPAEVELVVQRHPAVIDAAVAGVPDESWGEVVTAFVVLRPEATLTLDALRRHCQEHLAPHKQPRRLLAVDAIPRTGPTQQVQRRRLVEAISSPISI